MGKSKWSEENYLKSDKLRKTFYSFGKKKKKHKIIEPIKRKIYENHSFGDLNSNYHKFRSTFSHFPSKKCQTILFALSDIFENVWKTRYILLEITIKRNHLF